jgi:outer membrane lipoprotein-sorting protein
VAPRRLTSLLLALLVAAGCARLLPPPRQQLDPGARRAVELLSERWGDFTDLRTLATLELERPDRRERFTGVLLVRRPDSVRFEALSPFGQPFLFLVLHEGELVVYNAASNEALLAPATADSMAKLLSLPFEPPDLVSILAGRPAPPGDLRRATIGEPEAETPSPTEDRTAERRAGAQDPPLVLVGPNNQLKVWMDLETGLARQVEVSGGRYAVLVTYTRDAGGRVSALRFDAPAARLRGVIEYRDPALGVGLDPDRFDLVVPPSAKVERMR